jgi:hypothetical protein
MVVTSGTQGLVDFSLEKIMCYVEVMLGWSLLAGLLNTWVLQPLTVQESGETVRKILGSDSFFSQGIWYPPTEGPLLYCF